MLALIRMAVVAAALGPTAAIASPDDLLPPLRRPPSAAGWTTFGVELGFFAGATTTGLAVAVAANLDDGEELDGVGPFIGLGSLAVTIAGTALGAIGFRSMAREGHWPSDSGWGAAGVFPGAMEGVALTGGVVSLVDRGERDLGFRISAVGAGAALGGLAGFFAFRGMARARGSAGWETLAFWCGFFLTELVGIVATAGTPADDGSIVLLLTAAGGAVTTAFVHLLLR